MYGKKEGENVHMYEKMKMWEVYMLEKTTFLFRQFSFPNNTFSRN